MYAKKITNSESESILGLNLVKTNGRIITNVKNKKFASLYAKTSTNEREKSIKNPKLNHLTDKTKISLSKLIVLPE